jgi:hypothetical protein
MPDTRWSDAIGGGRYSYKLYTAEEIKRPWKMYKQQHIINVRDGKQYVICSVNDEEEALVLAALIIRKALINPPCIVYVEEHNKVLVNCEYIGVDFEDVKKSCRFLTKIYLGLPNLKNIRLDLKGDPLFKDQNEDVDKFYKGRDFPTGGASSICPLPINADFVTIRNIHKHLPPGMTGII